MKYLLEEWSIKGGTLTQLEDALLHIGKKDVISGMLYYIVSIVICEGVKQDIITIVILLSGLLETRRVHILYICYITVYCTCHKNVIIILWAVIHT